MHAALRVANHCKLLMQIFLTVTVMSSFCPYLLRSNVSKNSVYYNDANAQMRCRTNLPVTTLCLGQIPRESQLPRVPSYGEREALSRVCLVINIKQMPYAMLMSRCH